MKHARKDYNRIQDPENKIPKDEPVFLLRGQDELAPDLLKQWAIGLLNRGGSGEMAEMVMAHSRDMVKWQKEHKKKLPDLPNPKPSSIFPGRILNCISDLELLIGKTPTGDDRSLFTEINIILYDLVR